jgi:hypothetical protein
MSFLVAVVLAAAAAGASGCSWPSSGEHPALVMCGTTLQAEGGGPEIAPYPAMRGSSAIDGIHGTGPLYFQVASGCAHGSRVTWLPRSAAVLVNAAYAADGQAVVVVLRPTAPPTAFRLVVTRDGRVAGSVTVEFAS